jgi:hypothetical protein
MDDICSVDGHWHDGTYGAFKRSMKSALAAFLDESDNCNGRLSPLDNHPRLALTLVDVGYLNLRIVRRPSAGRPN